jgi:hypothetical protein
MAGALESENVCACRLVMPRFGKSAQSAADFCRAEGVSVASFYYWRKRLAQLGCMTPTRYLSNGVIPRHSAANKAGARRLHSSTPKGKR